jgi:hypothetical protein
MLRNHERRVNKLQSAIAAATAAGHDFVHDPPHGLASVDRYTCKRWCAVLGNATNAYGSAVEEPCKEKSFEGSEEWEWSLT